MKKIVLTKSVTALVDDEDYEWLKQWSWCVNASGYAVRGYRKDGRQHHVYMHRFVMKARTKHIDHINGNKLDNRKANLREASRSQNLANRGKQKNNKSGFKGVDYHKTMKKWRARVSSVLIGYFDTPEEAARAYDAAAVAHYENFAVTNFPQEIR